MKSRIQVSFKTAWVCALTVEHSKVGSARDKRFLMQLVAVLALSPAVWAQQNPAGEDQTAELQKATQNPVANLILVPLQNNTNFGIGPLDRTQNVLNIQPVIPVQVSEKWKLITRTIVPLIYQPDVTQRNLGVTGLGDANPTFFLSPAKPGKLIWGIGPAFILPTATNNVLGQGKWSAGPSVVALVQPEHWTFGALVNNVWNFAGESDKPAVNQMLLQYFINYNLQKGWYISLSPIITANWKASRGNVWTVPVGGGIGRIMKFGAQPVNLTVQFYGNATHPAGTSPWSMRIQLAFLFPKLSKEQEKKMLEQKLKQLEQQPH